VVPSSERKAERNCAGVTTKEPPWLLTTCTRCALCPERATMAPIESPRSVTFRPGVALSSGSV
jgi:hypothetical protein